jgi:integrase
MEVIEMQCRKCKREIPDTAKYCQWCGAKQSTGTRKERTRGNGQGSAYKRGKTWTALWSDGAYLDEAGNYHRRRCTKGGFKTKTEALAYAADPPQKAAPIACPTLRDYYNTWYASDYLDIGKSKQCAYRTAWRKLAELADVETDKLTISMLQSCVDEQTSTYYPAKDMKTVLSHLLKRAVAEGHARTNLADFLRLPPLDEKEMESFTEDELKIMWEQYGSGNTFFGFLLVMVYSGMMPGEMFQLKKEMIDYEKQEIVGCGLKTKKRKKTPIVFPDIIAPVLADLSDRSESKIGKVCATNKWTFYDQYHENVKKAGIRDLPMYSCRHTTATALALGNIAPSVIQEIMRHTKFTTTQRYIHVDTTASHEAINTMVKK